MNQGLKDFGRSVCANVYTLTGYLAIPVSAACLIAGADPDLVEYASRLLNLVGGSTAFYSFFALGCTGAGAYTMRYIRKTREEIEEHGTIRPSFARLHREWYCYRQGMKLAAKEAGLEETLEELL